MAFANPIFLWAMGLAVIPLWLHLSHRRKFLRLDIGTLRFLREARRPRHRKARWEEILLMLLRIGATLLLALLFARPTLSRRPPVESGTGTLLVMLDASGSMTSRMTREAGDLARQVLAKNGGSGASAILAQFSDRVERLESLADFRPRKGAPTRLDRAIHWALDRFIEAGARESGRLVLIGHFAASSLPENPPRLWPAGIEVTLLPLAPKEAINFAVTGIELRTPYQTDAMEIEARLHLPPEAGPAVKLETEGYVEEKTLRPGNQRVLFRFRPPKDEVRGWISLTLPAGGDAWPLDDRRPFAFRWTARSRVLLIDGDPGGTPFDGEAYFLKKALEASGAEHGLSSFAPEISYGLETRQGLTNLSEYDAVALCGVGEITATEVSLLRNFVDQGGGLFVVLGQGWGPSLYTSLADAGLFPGKSADNPGTNLRGITWWESKHPALEAFDGVTGGDLGSLPWRDGYEIQADGDWEILARLDSERPILLGNGRVLVCPHPLNREWTDLPREPVFVPFVKGIFGFLTGSEAPSEPARILTAGVAEDRKPGWYILPDGPDEVVVTDSTESRVNPADPDEVAAALGLPRSSAGKDRSENDRVARLARQISEPRPYELWPWIALGLLAWLVVEGIVATALPRDQFSR